MAKRSEALELIQDIISYKNDRLREVGEEADAEEILSALEKLGMLPPLSNETLSKSPLSVTEAILESVAYDFKWED